jgi:hypothetical protein
LDVANEAGGNREAGPCRELDFPLGVVDAVRQQVDHRQVVVRLPDPGIERERRLVLTFGFRQIAGSEIGAAERDEDPRRRRLRLGR